MKIGFLGDTHGNWGHYQRLIGMLSREEIEVDAIIQVGDFGFWEHRSHGVDFLDRMNTIIGNSDIPFYWIDGNHENFEYLYRDYVQGDYDDFIAIRSNINYIPRGMTWEWDAVRFMGFGGAYSIDKSTRTNFVSWWAEEVASDEEVAHAVSKGEVDVLITHDVANLSPILAIAGLKMIPATFRSREQLDKVVASAKPSTIVHGHYHHAYRAQARMDWGDVDIIGLDCDTARSWTDCFRILDTEVIRVTT